MPIDYTIDSDRNLIASRAWGTLTDGDLAGHVARQLADPRFVPGINALIDFADVIATQLSPAGIAAVAEAMRGQANVSPDARIAIVAPDPLAFGMSRMYQSLTDDYLPNLRVFRSRAEAEGWVVGDGAA